MNTKTMIVLAIVFGASACSSSSLRVQAGETDIGSIQNRVVGTTTDEGGILDSQAQALSTAGRFDEAAVLFKKAIEYWQTHPVDGALQANCLNNLALLYEKENKLPQAVPIYKDALALLEKTPNKNSAQLALTLDNLAQAYRRQGMLQEAEPLYKRALAIEEKIMKPDDQDHAITMFNLSLLYLKQRKYDLCEPLMTKSLAVLKNTEGETSPSYLNSYIWYLTLLRQTNRTEQANHLEAELRQKVSNH